MEQDTTANIVNVLYYLYFENRELVYHFERVWTEDGMRYHDDEYAYIFCGMKNPNFPVNMETYYFLHQNDIIEETSGNEHDCIYTLTEYYRANLWAVLKEKYKEKRTLGEPLQ